MLVANWSKVILSIVGLAAGAGVTQYAMFAGQRVYEVPVQLSPSARLVPQQSQSRTFREGFSPVQMSTLTPMRRPGVLRILPDGDLLVFDWDGLQLRRFTRDGVLKTTFEGSKSGASLLNNPTDYGMAPNGEIWVTDPPGRRIAVFEANGQFSRMIQTPAEIYNFVQLGGGVIAALPGGVTPHLVEIYDSATLRMKAAAGYFLEDWKRVSVSLSGGIAASSDGSMVLFGGNFVGLLAAFGQDGAIRYLRETIDRTPPPAVQVTRFGSQRIPTEATRAMFSLSADGEVVVATAPVRGRSVLALDYYRASTGDYLYSVDAPLGAKRVYVRGDRLYSMTRNIVTVWSTRLSSPGTGQ